MHWKLKRVCIRLQAHIYCNCNCNISNLFLRKHSAFFELAASDTRVMVFQSLGHGLRLKCSICLRSDNLYFISRLCLCFRTERTSVVFQSLERAHRKILLREARYRGAVACGSTCHNALNRGSLIIPMPAQPTVGDSWPILWSGRVRVSGTLHN